MFRYVGYDRNGVPRVYGESLAGLVHAYGQCLQAVREYIRGRPDTGPVSSWLIEEQEEKD